MKIRTDFVTNSSSSSFLVVNVNAKTLSAYLRKNSLKNIFNNIAIIYEERFDIVRAELDKSIAQSLISILKDVSEDIKCGVISEKELEADEKAINDLIKFIKQNKDIIDIEAKGNIELLYSDGEDGYAYAQSLVYKNHHGRLTKWPYSNGWDSNYSKIQEFNAKMTFNGIPELEDLKYDAIWDIIYDKKALKTAIERTGVVEEFDIQPIEPMKVDLEKDFKLENIDSENTDFEKDFKLKDIGLVNVDWIQDALFVFTGLSENDESIATDIIKKNGGIIKSSVVLNTNYVVYNPDYDHETVKMKRAKELIEKGKSIRLLTVSEFCRKLETVEQD